MTPSEFFKELNRIQRLHAANKLAKQEFRRTMEKILESDSCWPVVFQQGMFSRHDVLVEEVRSEYEKLVSEYLSQSGGSLIAAKQCKITQNAKGLLEYLRTHKLDPDNSLIGLQPAEHILQRHCSILLKYTQNSTSQQPSLVDVPSPVPKSSSNTDKEALQLNTSSENLINQIIEWSEMADPHHVFSQVQKFGRLLRSRLKYVRGDLVIACVPPTERQPTINSKHPRILYCRVEELKENVISLCPTPTEQVSVTVPLSHVIPFPGALLNLLGNRTTMKRLVENPVDTFFREIVDVVNERVKNLLLQRKNISVELIDRAINKQITFRDILPLQDLTFLLRKLKEDPSTEAFYRELDQYALQRAQEFKQHLDPSTLFIPSQNPEEITKPLRNINVVTLADRRILSLIERCESGLNYLCVEKEKLQNGVKKREMTEWWLQIINDKVTQFLVERGFQPNTIPDDYIDNPPKNIQAIHDNLHILQLLLKPQQNSCESAREFKKFVNDLCDVIYPKIDEFLDNVRFLIVEQLNKAGTPLPEIVNLSGENHSNQDQLYQFRIIEQSFKDPSRRKTIKRRDPYTFQWMDDLLQDYEYIMEMKQLEEDQGHRLNSDTPSQTGGKLRLTRAVPISGLIIGCFARLEKEHNTVLELWANQKFLRRNEEGQKSSLVKDEDNHSTPSLTKLKSPSTINIKAELTQSQSAPNLNQSPTLKCSSEQADTTSTTVPSPSSQYHAYLPQGLLPSPRNRSPGQNGVNNQGVSTPSSNTFHLKTRTQSKVRATTKMVKDKFATISLAKKGTERKTSVDALPDLRSSCPFSD